MANKILPVSKFICSQELHKHNKANLMSKQFSFPFRGNNSFNTKRTRKYYKVQISLKNSKLFLRSTDKDEQTQKNANMNGKKPKL